MNAGTPAGDPTPTEGPVTLAAALDALRDDLGRAMRQITDERPTLTVLLRHAGCTFCRQTLSDLAQSRAAISDHGLSIAVIGMSDSTVPLRRLGERYGVAGVAWIADPHRLMYRALEIGRGRCRQLFGPRVVWSGFLAALRGHGIGSVQGDPFQMPGTAIVHHGVVVRRYVHQTAADSPDLGAFACGLETE